MTANFRYNRPITRQFETQIIKLLLYFSISPPSTSTREPSSSLSADPTASPLVFDRLTVKAKQLANLTNLLATETRVAWRGETHTNTHTYLHENDFTKPGARQLLACARLKNS